MPSNLPFDMTKQIFQALLYTSATALDAIVGRQLLATMYRRNIRGFIARGSWSLDRMHYSPVGLWIGAGDARPVSSFAGSCGCSSQCLFFQEVGFQEVPELFLRQSLPLGKEPSLKICRMDGSIAVVAQQVGGGDFWCGWHWVRRDETTRVVVPCFSQHGEHLSSRHVSVPTFQSGQPGLSYWLPVFFALRSMHIWKLRTASWHLRQSRCSAMHSWTA